MVVPFGLVSSSAAMISCLELALDPEIEEFVSIFIDDILVISISFADHLKHMKIVFDKLQQANLVLNKEEW